MLKLIIVLNADNGSQVQTQYKIFNEQVPLWGIHILPLVGLEQVSFAGRGSAAVL